MVEKNFEYKHPVQSQPRMEWYRMYSFLKNIGQASASYGLKDRDMVHIGGTASFFWCFQAFGPRAVFHFRGTHDLDLLAFREGAVEGVLHSMRRSSGESPIDPQNQIVTYDSTRSTSLPNKKSFAVELVPTNDPAVSNNLKIDVFEPESGAIKLNDRELYPDRIVFDTPVTLKLPNRFGYVSVPSLRDSFVLKAGVVDFSQSGLRPKDMFDILVMARICDILVAQRKESLRFEDLVAALVEETNDRQNTVSNRKDISVGQISDEKRKLRGSLLSKLDGIENAFRTPLCVVGNVPKDYPLIPSKGRIFGILDAVKQIKRTVK